MEVTDSDNNSRLFEVDYAHNKFYTTCQRYECHVAFFFDTYGWAK